MLHLIDVTSCRWNEAEWENRAAGKKSETMCKQPKSLEMFYVQVKPEDSKCYTREMKGVRFSVGYPNLTARQVRNECWVKNVISLNTIRWIVCKFKSDECIAARKQQLTYKVGIEDWKAQNNIQNNDAEKWQKGIFREEFKIATLSNTR